MEDYIKKKIRSLKPSATLAINEKSRKLLEDGKKVFRFGFGQSPFPVPEGVISALKKNADKKNYLSTQGLAELRKAISKYLNGRTNKFFDHKNIIVGPGSKELMFLLHLSFDGDIILPAPSWVSYEPQAIIGRNKVHWLQTSRDNNWFPTSKEIEKKIKSLKKKKYNFNFKLSK